MRRPSTDRSPTCNERSPRRRGGRRRGGDASPRSRRGL
jgi:hypothetical protein